MAVSAGTGYAATYLKGKQEILKQRLQWAETELKQKYASDVAYIKDREAAFKGVEDELTALRKEREEFGAAMRAAAAKGAKGGSDWRTTLLQERTTLATKIAEESTKVSGQRVDLVTKAEDQFIAPVAATDQVSRAIGGQVGQFNVQAGRTTEAAIDNFLLRDPSLEVAFNGLSQGQKQALAIHVFNETSAQVRSGKGGQPLTAAEEARRKTDIETRFAVNAADIDQARLDANKLDKTEEYLAVAGTTKKDMEKALKYIDDQLALEGQGATMGDKVASEASTGLRALAISSYQNDGVIDVAEKEAADRLINGKVLDLIVSNKEAIRASMPAKTAAEIAARDAFSIQPTEQEIAAATATMKRTLGFLDPEKSYLENYVLTNVDDPVLQTYVREGELTARKKELGPYQKPYQVAAPTADDIQRRGAELYYPERTQRGFGKATPFYAPETARARRAFEQGEDMTNPALGKSMQYRTPPGPDSRFGPKEGAKGRRAPATSFYGAAADEIMGYTRTASDAIAANGGKFVPETIDGPAGEIYNDISARYKKGELKFDDLYDEVSGSTTNSADMTATLGGAEAAKEAKRKVLYNVLGSAYEQFLTNAPAAPPAPPAVPGDYGDYANEDPRRDKYPKKSDTYGDYETDTKIRA
jgi:hypothetical protein